MGFYLKKSVSLGGVRINFSKSGVGLSVGIKGFRMGTGPRGSYVHMGREGLYYRASLGHKRPTQRNHPVDKSHCIPSPKIDDGLYFREIESENTEFLTDATSKDIIEEINMKIKRWPIWPICILLSFGGLIGCIIGLILSIFIYILIDQHRKKVFILYDIDENTEKCIQDFYDGFSKLSSCIKIWHISEEASSGSLKKYHAGASLVVKRTPIKIGYGAPNFIKTNVSVPNFPVGKQHLYFFPDKLFICEKNIVAAMSYDALLIKADNQHFIEADYRPEDGTIIEYTWLYTNKNGGPDKRFKNNRQIPIFLYSDIKFMSSTGLNEEIQASKKDVGIAFKTAFIDFLKSGALGISVAPPEAETIRENVL